MKIIYNSRYLNILITCFLWIAFGLTNPQFLYGQDVKGGNPYEVGITYTADIFSNVAGGNDTGIKYLDNIDVDLKIDFGKITSGLDGASVYIYGMGNQGGSISGLAGDVQGLSNIESENSWRIYEFWGATEIPFP